MLDLAYTAGLVDGEGSITLVRRAGENRYPVLSVASTSIELLNFLKSKYGGVVITKRKCAKPHHKPSFTWQVVRNRALALLQDLLPFLREEEKLRRANMLLTEYKDVTKRNGKYSPEQLIAKRDFEKRFFSERLYARQHPVAA